MCGGTPTKTPSVDKITAEGKAILSNLDFYKVGHHGSTNANPIDAVKALRDGCVAMCSTQPGAYGNPKRGTEVPRAPLLAALDQKTEHQLARSDQVALSADEATNETPPTAEAGPLPKIFKAGPNGELYVDYEM